MLLYGLYLLSGYLRSKVKSSTHFIRKKKPKIGTSLLNKCNGNTSSHIQKVKGKYLIRKYRLMPFFSFFSPFLYSKQSLSEENHWSAPWMCWEKKLKIISKVLWQLLKSKFLISTLTLMKSTRVLCVTRMPIYFQWNMQIVRHFSPSLKSQWYANCDENELKAWAWLWFMVHGSK